MRYLIVILFTLASCQFSPKLKLPKVATNKDWQIDVDVVSNKRLIKDWWNVFEDKTLNDLVDLALEHNYDIRIALQNIEKLRLQKNIATSDFFPEADYNLDGQRTSYSDKITDTKTDNQLDSSFDLSWEIDFWGKVRNERKSAKFEYLAQIDVKKALMISVSTQLITNYIELRSWQKLLEITNKNIDLLEQTIRLTKIRERAGVVTNFDVMRAKSQKEIVQATKPNIKSEIYQRIYAIAVLVGKNPTALKADLKQKKYLKQVDEIIPIGLPADLLKNRPDIKKARNLLVAKNAEIGSAIADFFPNISLTGSIGNSARNFSQLFSANSSAWQYGFDLNLPIFRAGQLISDYKITKVDKKIAILDYEKTVLDAFLEVETSLVKYGKEVQTRDQLRRAVSNNKKIVNIAEARYRAGLDDLLSVIDAKRSLIEVENSLIESEARVLINLTSLIKALGGEV